MSYETISKLQFRPLLKNDFESIYIGLRDPSCEKKPFVYARITRFLLFFKKASTFVSNLKDVTRWLL